MLSTYNIFIDRYKLKQKVETINEIIGEHRPHNITVQPSKAEVIELQVTDIHTHTHTHTHTL